MKQDMLLRIARGYGTPVYVYDGNVIVKNYRKVFDAFGRRYERVKVCYACKANTSLAVLKILKNEGSGADVVSGGELHAALKAGFKAGDIIYTSNSKSDEKIRFAIRNNILINVDSVDELETLGRIAKREQKKARISFRINPSVNPKTHPKIATGLRDSKFGIHIERGMAFDAYKRASEMKVVKIEGIHMHIGSQITKVDVFREAVGKLMNFVLLLREGLDIKLKIVDIGGGIGIGYKGEKTITPEEFARAVIPIIRDYNKKLGYRPELWIEPGRYIVGPAGVLLTKVNSVKRTPYKKFINVDCGFNTLVRPVMYDAYHEVLLLGKKGRRKRYDVAGNLCESGDILAKNRLLPKAEKEDILAILDVGAYGFSMASQYNSQPLPAEILVMKNKTHVIRERSTYNELYRKQKIPAGL